MKYVYVVVRGYDDCVFGAHTTVESADAWIKRAKERGHGGEIDKWRVVRTPLYEEGVK